MDPLTALAALAPLVVDFGKGLIARYIAPDQFKPSNVAEWLQMRTADVDLFKAMNEAGGTGASYPWVEAIVRLQRPGVAGVALLVWAWSHTYGVPSVEIDNFTAAVGFYLFGDRTLFYSKRAMTAATAK
jgi:hypothetical protein